MAGLIKKKPEWFRIRNYSGAKNLDLSGWFLQLQVRSIIRTEWMLEKEAQALREAVRRNPIFDWSHVSPGTKAMLMSCCRSSWTQRSVRPMTVGEIFYREREYNVGVRDRLDALRGSGPAEKVFSPVLDGDSEGDVWYQPAYWHMHGSRKAIVEVDLDTPDRELTKHFNAMIRRLRGDDPRGKFTTRRMILSPAKWLKLAVLPYLDLRQWEIDNELEIGPAKMAHWIFLRNDPVACIEDDGAADDADDDDDFGSADNVRKTTAGLAEWLLTPSVLSAIEDAVGRKTFGKESCRKPSGRE